MEEINYNKIRFTILGVFVAIFLPIIIYTKSDFYLRKEYLNFRDLEFKATVSTKFDEHPIKANKIYLKNGPELRVQRDLFDELKIGDSVIKRKNSDSIIFFTTNGLIYDDYNKHLRELFLKSIR